MLVVWVFLELFWEGSVLCEGELVFYGIGCETGDCVDVMGW